MKRTLAALVLLLALVTPVATCTAVNQLQKPVAVAPADGVAVSPYDDYATVFISNQNLSYVAVYMGEYEGDRGYRVASLDSQQTQRVVVRIHPDRRYCITVKELAGETRMIGCVDLESGMTLKITVAEVLGFSTVVPGWST